MKQRVICLALVATVALPIGLAHSQPAKPVPPSTMETVKPAEPVKPAESAKAATGVIDDSIVNRLAIGMSDTEVFTLAGPPKYPGGDNLPYASRWVYVVGDQFVELSFGSGHVVEIKRLQTQGGMAR